VRPEKNWRGTGSNVSAMAGRPSASRDPGRAPAARGARGARRRTRRWSRRAARRQARAQRVAEPDHHGGRESSLRGRLALASRVGARQRSRRCR
jgi:hypothetical protein